MYKSFSSWPGAWLQETRIILKSEIDLHLLFYDVSTDSKEVQACGLGVYGSSELPIDQA